MKIVCDWCAIFKQTNKQFPKINCVRKVGLKVDNYFEHRIIAKT